MTFPVDLHLHTYYSDGSFSPIEVIEKAAQKGLKAIAITDHDYFTYTPSLANYAKLLGVELMTGIELSCIDETTKRKVHLLVYGLNENHEHIKALTTPFRKQVKTQRLKMIEALQQKGFAINDNDVKPFTKGLIYKQHIALALEKLGYGHYQDLYSLYFKGEHSLEKQFPITYIPIKKAIEAALKDGGIPILAHPRAYRTFEQIPKYISWGLKGVEISHPSYRDGDLEKVLIYPLLHTGGSDFHGDYNLSSLRQIGHYGIDLETYQQLKGEIKQ